MTLVSENIRYMRIFAGVPQGGGIKWQWSCRTCRHSRSFILQSITGRQGVAYRHIIVLLALPLTFPKK